MCTRGSAIVQWRNVSITVSLLNQHFTHWSDRDFIITDEKSLLVIFSSISTIGRSVQNINKDGSADGVRRHPNIWQNWIQSLVSKGDRRVM